MKQKNENLCIASLILGIFSILLCTVPILGIILTIISMIVALKTRKMLITLDEKSGLVTAGLILSIIALVFAIIITLLLIFYFGTSIYLKIGTTKDVYIPNLVGLTVQEAKKKTKKLGLYIEVKNTSNENVSNSSIVISQEPEYMMNYKIKEKSIISITTQK